MKRLVSALALLAGFAAPAMAADIYSPGGSKDTGYAGTPFLPQGFYISAGIGGGLTDTNLTAHSGPLSASIGDFNFSGLSADGRLGYDYRVANTNVVFGAFVGVGVDDVKGNVLGLTGANQVFNYEVGGRVGYVVNHSSMIYLGAGYASQHISASSIAHTPGASTYLGGPEVLGGLEIDISSYTGKAGLFLSTEAEYKWFDDWSHAVATHTSVNASETEFTQKLRFGLRF